MAYHIRAWLDRDGTPQLRVLDAESGVVRLSWRADAGRAPVLQSLFHELMLLSLRERLMPSAGRRRD